MVEGPDLEKAVWVRCLGLPRSQSSRKSGRRAYDAEDDLHDGRVVVDREEEEEMRREAEGDAWGPVEVSCGFASASRDDEEDTDMDASQRYGSTQRSRRSDRGAAAGERIVQMRRGEIWLVRWSGVRSAVNRGECELI